MFKYLQKTIYLPLKAFITVLGPSNVVELGIIMFILAVLAIVVLKWYKLIKGTPAERFFKSSLLLFLALLLSKMFNLQILGKLLESIVNIVMFGLIVIFQPELRRLLGYLGQPAILTKNIFAFGSETEVKNLITETIEAVKHLSKSHTGALIVIQNMTGFENYIEVGTKIDAQISTELLLTIFHPNTPLHDGAVVISGGRITAAGVLLPLTEDPTLSWKYGTRHRAAIGMSEVSDAACVVVSEETGEISLAQGGILTKYTNVDDLKIELDFLYGFSESTIEKPKEQVKLEIKKILQKKAK